MIWYLPDKASQMRLSQEWTVILTNPDRNPGLVEGEKKKRNNKICLSISGSVIANAFQSLRNWINLNFNCEQFLNVCMYALCENKLKCKGNLNNFKVLFYVMLLENICWPMDTWLYFIYSVVNTVLSFNVWKKKHQQQTALLYIEVSNQNSGPHQSQSCT